MRIYGIVINDYIFGKILNTYIMIYNKGTCM